MPRRKFIDKKNATTFALVHRAGDDAQIHDEDANPMVFAEKSTQQPRALRRAQEDDYAYSSAGSVASDTSIVRSSKVKQRGDLEDEFGLAVRANEGEAAQHGVFFDDSDYDYMQHMRDLGAGGGSVTWVDATAPPQAKKGKQRLEDALRSMDLESESGAKSVGTADTGASKARSLLPEEVLPSEFVRRGDYQDQQDVPDEIAGFQPDMDPRLREVLEALDDEAYVDDQDDDDVFGELMGDGYDIDRDEFERMADQGLFEGGEEGLQFEDDEGWESDDTIKASSPPPGAAAGLEELKEQGEMLEPPSDVQAPPPADPTQGAWLEEFKKFKKASKTGPSPQTQPSEGPAPTTSTRNTNNKRKKRNGAASTNMTMSSASLARTEHQHLLDSRFDKIAEDYSTPLDALDEEADLETGSQISGFSKASGFSTTSSALSGQPQTMRTDFDGILDSFLASNSGGGGTGGRRIKKGKGDGRGLDELDRVRRELGPARVKGKTAQR